MVRFNNASDELKTRDLSPLTTFAKWNVSCWVKLATTASQHIWTFYDTAIGLGAKGIFLRTNASSKIEYVVNTAAGTRTITSTSAISADTWYFIVVNRKNNGSQIEFRYRADTGTSWIETLTDTGSVTGTDTLDELLVGGDLSVGCDGDIMDLAVHAGHQNDNESWSNGMRLFVPGNFSGGVLIASWPLNRTPRGTVFTDVFGEYSGGSPTGSPYDLIVARTGLPTASTTTPMSPGMYRPALIFSAFTQRIVVPFSSLNVESFPPNPQADNDHVRIGLPFSELSIDAKVPAVEFDVDVVRIGLPFSALVLASNPPAVEFDVDFVRIGLPFSSLVISANPPAVEFDVDVVRVGLPFSSLAISGSTPCAEFDVDVVRIGLPFSSLALVANPPCPDTGGAPDNVTISLPMSHLVLSANPPAVEFDVDVVRIGLPFSSLAIVANPPCPDTGGAADDVTITLPLSRLVLSANPPCVDNDNCLSAAQSLALERAGILYKVFLNRAVTTPLGGGAKRIDFYDDDQTTIIDSVTISADGLERTT